MIASMTGYGKGEASHLSANYSVEVRSVNHRFCDVSVQTPRWLKPLDSAVKRLVQEKFERGRFDVSISVSYPEESTQRELKVDHALARSYVELFKSMKKELGLGGAVDLSLILQLRDVLKLEEKEEAPEDAWDGVSQALGSALESLRAMRESEGKALYEDMVTRLRKVQALVGEIRVRQPVIVEEYRQRLRDRVAQLLPEGGLDPQRLEQEVVIFAEKSDISEELVRLESHITEFKKLMDSRQAVGRKLDFLLQEMNREINTVASKALDTAASRAAVEVKSELEKMKQQVQNVE
jgi:uncharacterized protein (TIGR00255 family)